MNNEEDEFSIHITGKGGKIHVNTNRNITPEEDDHADDIHQLDFIGGGLWETRFGKRKGLF